MRPPPLDETVTLGIGSSLTYAAMVFNNKTFTIREVSAPREAYEATLQPYPILCRENIKLYRQQAFRIPIRDNCLRDQ